MHKMKKKKIGGTRKYTNHKKNSRSIHRPEKMGKKNIL